MRPGAPLWLAVPSRYARMRPAGARIVLALLLALTVAMMPWPPLMPPRAVEAAAQPGETDVELYAAIVDRLRHGDDYYAATAQELRARHFPLRPFVTFRPPLLARIAARLPPEIVPLLAWLLVAATAVTWLLRLAEALPDRAVRTIAVLLLAAGLFTATLPAMVVWHELWAGLLIAWSIALRRPGRWIEAAAIATVAMLIRETAALYAVVMAFSAWAEGERREATGWIAALGVLAIATAAHAWGVAQVAWPTDPSSGGWTGFNGPAFFAMALQHATALAVFPFALVVPVIALALFGWTAWRSPLGARMAATLAVYGLLIALFARADNFYWGLMTAPVFLAGLLFVPDGLRDLFAAALDRRRITVTRVTR